MEKFEHYGKFIQLILYVIRLKDTIDHDSEMHKVDGYQISNVFQTWNFGHHQTAGAMARITTSTPGASILRSRDLLNSHTTIARQACHVNTNHGWPACGVNHQPLPDKR
jgi:hypothetical protein